MMRNIVIIISLLVMTILVIYANQLFQENKKLSESLKSKSDSLKIQLDSNLILLNRHDSLINMLSSMTAETSVRTQQDSSLRTVVQNLKGISQTSARLNNTSAFERAAVYERQGFTALINDQFDVALAAFNQAEKTSSSFHMAYEISRLLQKNQRGFNNPGVRQRIKKEIITNYSWKAPDDLIQQLKKQVREQEISNRLTY